VADARASKLAPRCIRSSASPVAFGLRAFSRWAFGLWAVGLAALAAASLGLGAADLGTWASADARLILMESRLPRTFALVLAGAGSAVAGALMQMLAQNRFVEPSTVGAVEGASLGALLALLFFPEASPMTRMAAAALCALGTTALFLKLLSAMPMRGPAEAPLIGILLGGVIGALGGMIAWRADMMQAMGAWTSGDFAQVLRGRYEMLWIAGAAAAAAWAFADRFTLAGMGRGLAEGLGLNWRRTLALGLSIVALVTACTVVTVGMLPFLGLVAPNVISRVMGDNLRAAMPHVALLGATLTMACDVIGRIVIRPYELPIGAVMGVLGATVFLWLLLRPQRAGGPRHD
jgi:iron complex transport system permease protein